MSVRSQIFALFAVALVVTGTSARAGDNKSIQGTVTGVNGKAFGGAEIRAERIDAKAKPVIARTDAKGHYVFSGLPAGAYTVTAYVDGDPQSRATIRTRSKGWAKVDFDLRLSEDGGADVDRMQRDLRLNPGANPGR